MGGGGQRDRGPPLPARRRLRGWTERISASREVRDTDVDPDSGETRTTTRFETDVRLVDRYAGLGGDGGGLASALVVVLAAGTASFTVLALLATRAPAGSRPAPQLRPARRAAFAVAAAVAAAGVLFEVLAYSDDELEDWWLDVGFYGGLAGSATAAILLWSAGWSSAPAAPPPGWYPDPARRHEHRWWDGRRWTPGVADRGATSSDPMEAVTAAPAPEHGATAPALAQEQEQEALEGGSGGALGWHPSWAR